MPASGRITKIVAIARWRILFSCRTQNIRCARRFLSLCARQLIHTGPCDILGFLLRHPWDPPPPPREPQRGPSRVGEHRTVLRPSRVQVGPQEGPHVLEVRQGPHVDAWRRGKQGGALWSVRRDRAKRSLGDGPSPGRQHVLLRPAYQCLIEHHCPSQCTHPYNHTYITLTLGQTHTRTLRTLGERGAENLDLLEIWTGWLGPGPQLRLS